MSTQDTSKDWYELSDGERLAEIEDAVGEAAVTLLCALDLIEDHIRGKRTALIYEVAQHAMHSIGQTQGLLRLALEMLGYPVATPTLEDRVRALGLQTDLEGNEPLDSAAPRLGRHTRVRHRTREER